MQALQFLQIKRDNLDTTTNGFLQNSELGKIFKKAERAFAKKYSDTPNADQKAYEMAMAAVLTVGNTGITLNKRNPNTGKFEPIRVSQRQDPNKPRKFTFEQDCL